MDIRPTSADAVLLQHLEDDLSGGVPDCEEKGLVGHVLAEGLPVDLEGAPRIRSAILTRNWLLHGHGQQDVLASGRHIFR